LKHFNVLTTVLVLIVGVWAIIEFRQRARRYPKSGLDDLWRFMIFFNAAELAVFLSLYWESNLTPAQAASLASWYKLVEWPILAALILGVHLSLYRAIFRFRDREFPKWIVPAVVVFAVAEIGWFFLAINFPALMPQGPVMTFWFFLIWPLDILDMVLFGLLLAESRKASDPGRRKVEAALALLFLARYPVHLALTVWRPAEAALFWAIAITKLLALYTNLLPILWLKAYFVPWAGSLGKVLGSRFDLAALGRSRGLSAREMEILSLMIDGKSYKEIESSLHISIHTVKSHVYNLYRKMDVKSRHQLIHRIGVYASEGPA
jgi:DNA-binding CsgD family transcriptional regulator